MRFRLVLIGTLLLTSFALPLLSPEAVQATHNATQCKWDFPWPKTVYYWIEEGSDSYNQFLPAEATRVSYGPATWTEGGFNLQFSRVYSLSSSTGGSTYIAMGFPPASNAVAQTFYYYPNGGQACNRDQGNPIIFAYTIFDQDRNFNLDCNAYHSTCINQEQYDYHDISSHELGHWFFLGDIYSEGPTDATMFWWRNPGDYFGRDLASHDKDGGWIMYGCRSGFVCH